LVTGLGLEQLMIAAEVKVEEHLLGFLIANTLGLLKVKCTR